MQIDLQKSPIGLLRDYLEVWSKRTDASNQTIAANIVAAHEEMGGPARTRITFSHSGDIFKQLATNCTKVFRWFDDREKDTNLLSVNFLPAVLRAMPRDLAMSWLNELLRPIGFCVRGLEKVENDSLDVTTLLCQNMKETAEANQAMAEYAANPTEAGLHRVERELAEEVEIGQKALAEVRAKRGHAAALRTVRSA
ncbi:hypothetical protein [Noviherbaspirillum suwonense]|uniref:KfrA N-terminal DNA-binding domain-containing protein n=1 Tax=Noviherbaspirillum suwonense TaxID=1224511 RepID=A0ABY1QL57_9BURK|nr:hypothetical protein [Noviherbaspirillum suwonense]SMP71782.1 hypothetical protein SAMN06295970_11773 [Noviherbaspirillum suwonense]